jgi:mannose-1-phosphate guanylyltransferase/phosphomannomutase
MKAVILAGGKGTRLGLVDRPKAMVPLGGVPLLERLVIAARDAGLVDIVLLTGHLAEVIEGHFGDGTALGVRITHVREAEPLGTAGAVRAARELLIEPFVVMYGDTLLDVDLGRFAAFHRERGGLGTLFVHPNDHPHDSDLLEADEDMRVRRFLPKPHAAGAILPNLVSAALYVIEPAAIDFIGEGASDWGHDVFPRILAAGGALHAYRSVEYVKDIGTPERLAKGERDLADGKVARLSYRVAKPALFLDRDGVLNHERNGVHRAEDLALTPAAAVAIRAANKAGVPAICVTNQPDIAKGFMTFDALREVMAALDTQLADGGAYIDDAFVCPHHPEAGWPGEVVALKIACDCRKPLPGLLMQAAERHHLDLARSWLIGDRHVDIAAAHAAGAKAVLLRSGYGHAEPGEGGASPDFVTDSLGRAVAHALEKMGA